MKVNENTTRLGIAFSVATLLTMTPATQAFGQCAAQHDGVVIRSTIPYPDAVKRSPLTSDQLSTTSTRFIDARRGFRPYSSLQGCDFCHSFKAAYDDHFGISRPELRPYSYSQRAPRTFVQQFTNTTNQTAQPGNADQSARDERVMIPRDDRREADSQEAPDMTIRRHTDRSAIPTTSGAVLITADGTVIQIGD